MNALLPAIRYGVLEERILPHINDPHLSVNRLTRLLATSRTSLHRCVKGVTGMSTTAFIRYLRIREATRLLSTHPERSVSEVAYEVGFNSHSYFTRCFRELTGALPNDVRTRQPETEHMYEPLEQTS